MCLETNIIIELKIKYQWLIDTWFWNIKLFIDYWPFIVIILASND